MYIGDVINLHCRGNRKFTIIFIGISLVVVQDCLGQEHCVDVNNIRRMI